MKTYILRIGITVLCLLLSLIPLASCSDPEGNSTDTLPSTSYPVLFPDDQNSLETQAPGGVGQLELPDYHGQLPATQAPTVDQTLPPPTVTTPINNNSTTPNDDFWTGESHASSGLQFVSLGNGCCAVSGIGSCADACVVIPTVNEAGERVVAIADKAFYACSSITAVYIPASITSIGRMAFAACPSLAYFTVDDSNLTYTDDSGVLWSSDRTVLLAYPAARLSTTVTLPKTLRMISDMAFYSAPHLNAVHYEGDSYAWQQVTVGASNNALMGISVRCLGNGK